jgi:hypothetical protein
MEPKHGDKTAGMGETGRVWHIMADLLLSSSRDSIRPGTLAGLAGWTNGLLISGLPLAERI